MARMRSGLLREIRAFFHRSGYLEVDTPALSPDLIPENHLDVFRTQYEPPDHASRELYLIPSPEVYLKRLLAAGFGNLFQIARSFRNGESAGTLHNPEFTMLEWYSVDADYYVSLDTTFELLQYLVGRPELEIEATARETVSREPLKLTVEAAFREYLGFSLAEALERDRVHVELVAAGLEPRGLRNVEELVNFALVDRIEPNLPDDRAVVLLRYPKRIPTLAREIPGTPWCERWELYLGGVELANCYTEEIDPRKVERFFAEQRQRKRRRGAAHAVDAGYPGLFAGGFPRCSGAALGVDRLLLVLSGARSVDEVMFFPFSATLRDRE